MPKKRKSLVYNHFDVDPADDKRLICQFCKSKITSHAGALEKHLRTTHVKQFADYEEEKQVKKRKLERLDKTMYQTTKERNCNESPSLKKTTSERGQMLDIFDQGTCSVCAACEINQYFNIDESYLDYKGTFYSLREILKDTMNLQILNKQRIKQEICLDCKDKVIKFFHIKWKAKEIQMRNNSRSKDPQQDLNMSRSTIVHNIVKIVKNYSEKCPISKIRIDETSGKLIIESDRNEENSGVSINPPQAGLEDDDHNFNNIKDELKSNEILVEESDESMYLIEKADSIGINNSENCQEEQIPNEPALSTSKGLKRRKLTNTNASDDENRIDENEAEVEEVALDLNPTEDADYEFITNQMGREKFYAHGFGFWKNHTRGIKTYWKCEFAGQGCSSNAITTKLADGSHRVHRVDDIHNHLVDLDRKRKFIGRHFMKLNSLKNDEAAPIVISERAIEDNENLGSYFGSSQQLREVVRYTRKVKLNKYPYGDGNGRGRSAEYQCSSCSKKFNTKKGLGSHKAKHNQAKFADVHYIVRTSPVQ